MKTTTLSDSAEEIRFHCDAGGRLEQVSPAWTASVGRTVEEMQGKSWLAFVSPSLRAQLEEQWRRAVAGAAGMSCRAGLIRHDGSEQEVSISLAPCLDGLGALLGYAGCAKPVRERARPGSGPDRVAMRLLEVLGLDAALVDGRGAVVAAGGALRSALHAVGGGRVRVERLLPRLEPWQQIWRDLEDADNGALRLRQPDGAELELLAVSDSEGDMRHALVAQRPAEDLRSEVAAGRLEAAGLLAGAIAHQLNNQLAIVLGSSELLAEDVTDAAASESLLSIQRSARAATQLAHQLGRLSSERAGVEDERVPLVEVFREIRPLLRSALGRLIVLDVDLPDLPDVRADRHRLELLLVNVAVIMRQRCPRGRLGFTARSEGDEVVLAVDADDAETGPARWLEPGFAALLRGAGGQAAPDGGTLEIRFARAPAERRESPAGRSRARGSRVLLVEDEDVTRDLLSRRLRSAGYAVTVAADGEQALDLYEALEDGVDLVVTDIVMPNRDGVSLAKQLRERNAQVRVLMISGQKTAADRLLDHESLQGTRVLQKPFSSESLVDEIRALLSGREPSLGSLA